MEQIQRMYPDFKAIGEPKGGILNFGSGSCSWNFIDMIAGMIDVCRKHYETDFEDLQMTIIRIPALYARLSWSRTPLEPEEKIFYKAGNDPAPHFQGKRRSEVSFNDPDTREFYSVLCDKLDELTVYANETETGLQLEYDEKNETVLLRRVTY